jgi:hypothetical protein
MNVTQTLEQEIAAIVSGNKLYNTYQGHWKYLLESYLGGKEYRDAGHLTRYQLETDGEYAARLTETPLDNHCQSVVSVYNSFLFRHNPDREFGALSNNAEVEDFLNDADFDGRSLNSFMKDVATWSSVFGHCWIIMAKPDVGAVTMADEIMAGVRPYVSLLTPLVVLDWSWTRSKSGRYTLDYFRYIEDVNGDIRTVKEWTPETIRTIIVDVTDNTINEDIIEVNGLGKIPAICAYNGRSTVRGIGVSDIADIADAQRFIYNAKSEISQSIRLDSHPSLVKTPETQAGIGAGSLIHMPENLDPGLKPYLLEFSGASVSSILSAIKDTVDSIDKMANTGSIRSTEAQRMSGVAQQQEFELLNARLSEKADNLELAEEQMWRLWCEYQGVPYSVEIDYPGSFNIRDTEAEVKQLQIVASTNPADPRVKAAIDMKILDWLDLDEDELVALGDPRIIKPDTVPEGEDYYVFEPHIMCDPVTGEERLVTTQEEHVVLANQGWYHKQ